jgi:hypothetical protein
MLVQISGCNLRTPDMGVGIYATPGDSYLSVKVVPG